MMAMKCDGTKLVLDRNRSAIIIKKFTPCTAPRRNKQH